MKSSLRAACLREMELGAGKKARFYALGALEQLGLGSVSRLPVSLRIVLESLVRNCDGIRVQEKHVRELASWQPRGERATEIPFLVGRVALNDTAGIPVLGDLATMRSAALRAGVNPRMVEPAIPVDMVMDHSLEVDYHASSDALRRNMELEVERNAERFSFVKWAIRSFKGIAAIPPGFGILHQVNLERLARLVLLKDGVCFADTVIGPDSHTGMIAGLGIVGWGAGGIEVGAAMLGQPVYFLTPDVVGVHLVGDLGTGVTATDLVLSLTALLRANKVAGKFVEFFGEGAANLNLADRATLANMSPEYGARLGFFAVDDKTCVYLTETGRPQSQVDLIRRYFQAQGCYGIPRAGDIDYSQVITLDLRTIVPSVSGPKRPQDRVALSEIKQSFNAVLGQPSLAGGYGRAEAVATPGAGRPPVIDGDVVIASITSCANTSNPGVMLAAGLLAKRAVELGLRAKPWVKTSLAPGSAVVSQYLEAAGLQQYLDALGFNVVGYGCATCVGNSGPISRELEQSIADDGVIACAVLSGNRNFEGRTHPAIRATYLMSPPLVVAFALSGTVDFDVELDPVGHSQTGQAIYLRDLWPDAQTLATAMAAAASPDHYRAVYDVDYSSVNPLWNSIPQVQGEVYPWSAESTYFREPPFFTDAQLTVSSLRPVEGARALAILGNSITTDHISPISNIDAQSPAGQYLLAAGVARGDFHNYGARRMNYEVLVRGIFANPRLRNLMVTGSEGGVTRHEPSAQRMTIYDAAMRYKHEKTPLIVIAGEEYGTGSARDWAAKGPRLLGVRAIVAASFERIHRSNLVGMGVLPCQFGAGTSAASLALDGSEKFDLLGLDETASPRQNLSLVVHRKDGRRETVDLILRVETEQELEYLRCGGILQYVFGQLRNKDSEHTMPA